MIMFAPSAQGKRKKPKFLERGREGERERGREREREKRDITNVE